MKSIAIVVALALVGCGSVKIEGDCTYIREIKTSYICEKGGTLDHTRVAPGGPPEP